MGCLRRWRGCVGGPLANSLILRGARSRCSTHMAWAICWRMEPSSHDLTLCALWVLTDVIVRAELRWGDHTGMSARGYLTPHGLGGLRGSLRVVI